MHKLPTFFSLLIIPILFFSFFAITPQKTEAACSRNPSILYRTKSDGVRSVTYHLRVINNCPDAQKIRIKVSHLPDITTRASDYVPNPAIRKQLIADWQVENASLNTTFITNNIPAGGSRNIDVTVIRDINFYHPDGEYAFVVFRAMLDSNTSYFDTYSNSYIVINRPDLRVSAFNYRDGRECDTANPVVRIKNIGWAPITQDFNVNVSNGAFASRTHRVTQRVDHDEIIDLSSRFSGMGYPNEGSYVAKAIVDSNKSSNNWGEVREEDEGDNSRTSDYKTTACGTPPPPPPPDDTYSISGGVFNDLNKNGIRDGEPYISGSFTINGTTYNSPFTVSALPQGTYRVIFSQYPSLANDFDLTTHSYVPPIAPFQDVTVNSSTGNVSGVDFGIAPVDAPAFDKWINGIGGDIRVDQGMINVIPDGFYFSEVRNGSPYFDHGLVFGTNLDLGGAGKTNENNWFVEDEPYTFPIVRTEYSEMSTIFRKAGLLSNAYSVFGNACSGTGPNCSLSPLIQNGLYTSNGAVRINNSSPFTFPNNKNFIFLIDGDLKIEQNLIIPRGSTVIYIVSGDITVAQNVTRIDGFFSTNKDFVVEGAGDGTDSQLQVQGSIVANALLRSNPDSFQNERDLGADNEYNSSVEIIARPDFVLHAPELIRYSNYTLREVAPGG